MPPNISLEPTRRAAVNRMSIWQQSWLTLSGSPARVRRAAQLEAVGWLSYQIKGQYTYMKINPLTFLEYSFNNPESWFLLVNQRIQHSKFGCGVIKEIRLGDSILKSSSATIQFDKKVESVMKGWTDTLEIGLRAFDGRMITELSLPVELTEKLASIESEKEERELEIKQLGEKRREAEEEKRAQFEREMKARNEFRLVQNEQELKRIADKQSRAKSIQEYCVEHHIMKLIHFTRLENLKSILSYGLLSRKSLQKFSQNQQPIFNDNHRFDGHLEAICLSISFPNYKMFYRLNQKNPRDWVVLVIEPYILWEFDCAFYRENAASNVARSTTLHQRKEYSSFVEMFSDYNHNKRPDLGIPSCYPTNPQAEVLVFEPINPTHILEVHFRDKATMQNWLTENKEPFAQKFETNSFYFTPRDDWAAWRSNTSEHVLVQNPENDFTF